MKGALISTSTGTAVRGEGVSESTNNRKDKARTDVAVVVEKRNASVFWKCRTLRDVVRTWFEGGRR